MHTRSGWLLLLVLCLGCNRAEEARRRAAENELQQLELALKNYQPQQPQSDWLPSHVVASDTDFYATSPQQGRPPDGTFPAGTAVRLVAAEDSYVRVRAENGVEAYVVAHSIQPAGIAPQVADVVEGSNQLAFDLYQQIRSADGNLFFSPTSIATALAMVYAGARGQTATEMAKTLHFPQPTDQLHQAMHALQLFWTSPDPKKGIRLHLANRLWGQESYQFLPAFLAVTRDKYGAELARLNFAQTETARQTINGWIEDQTADKITELFPAGVLASDTRLVLTNAVYFHGAWTEPFDKERTRDEDFRLTTSNKIAVPMMHRSAKFRIGTAADLQILELPYGDGSLSMFVLLPQEIDGLADLEARLTFQNVREWLTNIRHEDEVKVFLPRFKTSSQFQMADTLKALGMGSAFDADAADFSGMTGGRDLFISAVIHKAFVDVNEEGTEAAAATGIVMAPTGAPIATRPPPVFRADHPFVFLIRDNRNAAIVFLGRITNPLR